VRGGERSLAAVPAWVLLVLAASLAGQIAWRASAGAPATEASDLPPAPSAAVLRAASLGESAAAARVAMLWLQAFDLRGGNNIPYQRLDYARLTAWLRSILQADPRSGYPLFMAARIYAENADPRKMRAMLEFIRESYGDDPNGRWPALAHAALLAKHRLRDLPLARSYAVEIDRRTADPSVPLWARQMEIFILEDMGELEAAKVMLGGLIESGKITDPDELRFLQLRLAELEQRTRAGKLSPQRQGNASSPRQ
jgi:hypothetical protein